MNPGTTLSQLQETARFIQQQYPPRPEAAIVLGSGLANLVQHMEVEKEISYQDIPNFPLATVLGHPGNLFFGLLNGKRIVAMAGRFHYYEGYSVQDVVFPIRTLKLLGAETLLISNAAGGMNSAFRVGDLMLIRDHISLFTPNPLIGPNVDELGPRFPDMSEPYSKKLQAEAQAAAKMLGLELREGVYAGVTGPTFETRAEYRLLHLAGGDAVGMSTVQEVIAAAHMGMAVLAVSVITDLGIRETDNKITHEEVLEPARESEPKLTALFSEIIRRL